MLEYPGLWNLDTSDSESYSGDTFEELESKLAQKINLSGKAGAGEPQNFRLHAGYLRCVDIVIQQRLDPRFATRSDLYRYAVVLLLNDLKDNEAEYAERFRRELEAQRRFNNATSIIEQHKMEHEIIREWEQQIRSMQMDRSTAELSELRQELVEYRNNSPKEWLRDEVTRLIGLLPN